MKGLGNTGLWEQGANSGSGLSSYFKGLRPQEEGPLRGVPRGVWKVAGLQPSLTFFHSLLLFQNQLMQISKVLSQHHPAAGWLLSPA